MALRHGRRPSLVSAARQRSGGAFGLAAEPKEMVVLPGGGYFELYDRPAYVEPAVQMPAEFYRKNLLGLATTVFRRCRWLHEASHRAGCNARLKPAWVRAASRRLAQKLTQG